MKRNYLCTINFDNKLKDPMIALPDFTIYSGLKRATFQLERGEQLKRLHWQIFLEFKYPVSYKSIIKQTAEQGKQMHVSQDNTNRHPNAGRAYCTKGKMINGHRYIIKGNKWYISNPKGEILGDENLIEFKNPFKTTAVVKPPEMERYNGDYEKFREQAIRRLMWNMGECKNFIQGIKNV